MIISHEIVCAAWELIRVCPPFRRWKLPDNETIEFHVYKSKDGKRGEYIYTPSGKHKIRINNECVVTLLTLIYTLMHEAVHLRQQLAYPNDKAEHGSRFWTLAKQVCKHIHLPLEEF